MNRVAKVMKRGKSCFMAVLIFSYSLEAISKSCSSCTRGLRRAVLSRQATITLYRFFSSLRDFSFLSLNFVSELLKRS